MFIGKGKRSPGSLFELGDDDLIVIRHYGGNVENGV